MHRPPLLAAALAVAFAAAACGNDSADAASPSEGPGSEICDNGLDDDGDGLPDCEDESCAFHPACEELPSSEQSCDDGSDDDGDGLVDCADPDCAPDCDSHPTTETSCENGLDDDLDGDRDCDDLDCTGAPVCCLGAGCVGPEICDNGVDDNADGSTDCADQQCRAAPFCQRVELCDNAVDDDGNGRVDCDDAACAAAPGCALPERCGNALDDDLDGLTDCADPDCATDPACATPELCGNGLDDDGDGATDCADLDCDVLPACNPAEDCGNGLDDDGDGTSDCADSDCAALPACNPTEDCGNGIDDDGDSFVDCADFDCSPLPACQPTESCGNGSDDDGDRLVDCADPDCSAVPACAQTVAPGDLVFTEIMADPSSGGGDPVSEWFELHNPTARPLDLAGFGLSDLDGQPVRRHVITRSVVVPPGGFVVLAHTTGAGLGFVPAYEYGATALSLNNGGDQLELTDRTGVVIDVVDYALATFPAVQSGVSLDTAERTAAGNDAGAAWCASDAAPFNAAGERGTPGASGSCGAVAPREPRAGELVITELQYNPSGVEPGAEWLELLSTSTARLDLTGLLVSSGVASSALTAPPIVEPGARLVLCRDPAVGPAGCAGYGSLSLTNTTDDLTLTTAGGVVVDTVVYATVAPWPASVNGTSIELSESHLDAASNNDGARWCAATAVSGADRATPGAAGSCP